MPRLTDVELKEDQKQETTRLHAQEPQKRDPFDGLKFEDLKPYTGTKDLPPDKVEFEERKNEKGTVVVDRRIVVVGEPRFYMTRNARGWISVIAVYRNGKGVGRRNIRTLKPKLAKSADNYARSLGEQDAKIYQQLKTQGIPEEAAQVAD